MLTFISCAKTMDARCGFDVPEVTRPEFREKALEHALGMSQFSIEQLEKMLHINRGLAEENHLRYMDFGGDGEKGCPALLAYTGIVFKHIAPRSFAAEDFVYAQSHLLITSFLYGLLRPLDLIQDYRMEGNVRLPENGGITMFDCWKPLLTERFVGRIREEGGVLVNLASAEMKRLFDWKRVEREVETVTPEFQVWKDGRPVSVTVYAKMCRGEMTRFILKNRIEDVEGLKSWYWEGFRFVPEESTDKVYRFRMEF